MSVALSPFKPSSAPETGRSAKSVSRRLTLFQASGRAVLLNYVAAAALLLLGYSFYCTVPLYRDYFSPGGFLAIRTVLWAYLLLLPLYYATLPEGKVGKCRLFWRALFHLPVRRPTPAEAVALRAVLVKAFYLPLMLNWLVGHAVGLAGAWEALADSRDLWRDGYAALFSGLWALDVLCFSVGYAVEHPRLGNEIRSVEPTLLGWVAALVCYYPFHLVTMRGLGWYTTDYPAFVSMWAQAAGSVAMLALLGVYVWASVSLGLRASNLTNRGVVRTGPYAWVRHPAYASKNLFWCIGALPALLQHGPDHPAALVGAVLGLLAWCSLYGLRAITEERHLSQDPEYVEYCRQVPYRFIPGLW